ncbi:MAG TPA: type II toxin-antitoxin system prevent-host-death family antitoxin [Sphingomicrobium sp.]|nr:type II toxin-antitoxin system prevent-host-death family antitoxin [Sphingomicrobium sp.]
MNAERPIRKEVTIHEAKTHLSRLVARAEAGEEIVLKRGRVKVAKLVPLSPPKPKRRTPGRYAEEGVKGILDDGFWDPLPPDHLGLAMRDRHTP